MAVGSKFALTCAAGVGCAGSIPYVIKYRCSNSKERWVTPEVPFLTCTDSKGTSISISLAFRNEVGDEEKSEENLYLKGNGKAYGKKVDLYEKVDTSESRGVRDQYLWSLQVFKNSGTVRLMSVDQGGGTTRTSLELTCTGKKFEVSEETYKEKWDLGKPVNEITFEFGECTDKSGKETCDIKIADSVGLKWGNNFTPKAHFCKSSK